MNRRGGSIFQNPCQHRCPDGGDCCLNPAVPHKLHICDEPECPCHSKARYRASTPAEFTPAEFASSDANRSAKSVPSVPKIR